MPGSKPGEIVLYTEVITACSNRCDFCPIDAVERRGSIHPDVRSRVLELIVSSPEYKFIVYPHVIGEPLLFPGLVEYTRDLVALPNVELWVCTNGVLLDPPCLRRLHEAGLRNIWYSLFYASAADYRDHVRAEHFEAAWCNLNHLLDRSSELDRIHIVLFGEATPELEAIIRDKPNVTIQVRRPVHPWTRQGRWYDRRVFRFLFSSQGKLRTNYICVSIDGEIASDWRDYNFRNSMGNIREMDLATIRGRMNRGLADAMRRRIYPWRSWWV